MSWNEAARIWHRHREVDAIDARPVVRVRRVREDHGLLARLAHRSRWARRAVESVLHESLDGEPSLARVPSEEVADRDRRPFRCREQLRIRGELARAHGRVAWRRGVRDRWIGVRWNVGLLARDEEESERDPVTPPHGEQRTAIASSAIAQPRTPLRSRGRGRHDERWHEDVPGHVRTHVLHRLRTVAPDDAWRPCTSACAPVAFCHTVTGRGDAQTPVFRVRRAGSPPWRDHCWRAASRPPAVGKGTGENRNEA